MPDLQERAATWHRRRFPQAIASDVALKAMSELGEVSDALLADDLRNSAHPERAGKVLKEAADTTVALLVLCERYGYGDLLAAVSAKLAMLETPGAHPSSLVPITPA